MLEMERGEWKPGFPGLPKIEKRTLSELAEQEGD